jgi:hypothetical protein
MATIGFSWKLFVVGIVSLVALFENWKEKGTVFFIYFGTVVELFVVPIIQVSSLVYAMHKIRERLQLKSQQDEETKKFFWRSKKNAIIFAAIFLPLVIAVDPLSIREDYYLTSYTTTKSLYAYPTYPIYQFYVITSLFYNLAVTTYLTVTMFFLSLALSQIQALQTKIIDAVKADTISLSSYFKAKSIVKNLHEGTHEVMEKLALAAFINKLTWLFVVWLYQYEASVDPDFTAADMFLSDLLLGPYLLKEIGFFFYIVLKAAVQNTLQAELVKAAVTKHNDLIGIDLEQKDVLEDLKHRDIYKTIYMDSMRYVNKYTILTYILTFSCLIYSLPVQFKLLGKVVTSKEIYILMTIVTIYVIYLLTKP